MSALEDGVAVAGTSDVGRIANSGGSFTPVYTKAKNVADSVSPTGGGGLAASESISGATGAANLPVRSGKWTAEEEEYSNRLIHEFREGWLPLTDGTTLRTFLAKVLNCDPMRISKKYVGSNSIGKQVFKKNKSDISSKQLSQMIEAMHMDLRALEKRFVGKLSVPRSRHSRSNSLSGNSGDRHGDQHATTSSGSGTRADGEDNKSGQVGSRRSQRTTKNEAGYKRYTEEPLESAQLSRKRNRPPGAKVAGNDTGTGSSTGGVGAAWSDFDMPNSLSSVGKVSSLDMLCAYTNGEMPMPEKGMGLSSRNLADTDTSTGPGSNSGGALLQRQSVVDFMNLGLSSGPRSGSKLGTSPRSSSSSPRDNRPIPYRSDSTDMRIGKAASSTEPSSSPTAGMYAKITSTSTTKEISRGASRVALMPPTSPSPRKGCSSSNERDDVGMDYDAPTPRSLGSGSPWSPGAGVAAPHPYNPARDMNVSNSVVDSIHKFQERKGIGSGSGSSSSSSGVLSASASLASSSSSSSSSGLSLLKKQSNSVEDFFLLVNQGVISAPADNVLSRPLVRHGGNTSASSAESNSTNDGSPTIQK